MNAHNKAPWPGTEESKSRVTTSAESTSRKPGRRKAKVQELFESQGADAAWVLGLRLKLKESTLRTWFADLGASVAHLISISMSRGCLSPWVIVSITLTHVSDYSYS